MKTISPTRSYNACILCITAAAGTTTWAFFLARIIATFLEQVRVK